MSANANSRATVPEQARATSLAAKALYLPVSLPSVNVILYGHFWTTDFTRVATLSVSGRTTWNTGHFFESMSRVCSIMGRCFETSTNRLPGKIHIYFISGGIPLLVRNPIPSPLTALLWTIGWPTNTLSNPTSSKYCVSNWNSVKIRSRYRLILIARHGFHAHTEGAT